MNRIILIDADSFLYWNIEDLDQYKDKIDEYISRILVDSNSSHYRLFVEPFNNTTHRKLFISNYKANRANKERPHNYVEIKEYLLECYNPVSIVGLESDDLLISWYFKIKQEYPFSDVMIAGMDKDLKTFPIKMFDTYYRRFGDISEVSEDEADYNFYYQMIVGDSSDNIKGMKGKGKKYAETLLKQSKNRFITVCREYNKMYKSKWQKKFISEYVQLKLIDNIRVNIQLDKAEFF